MKTKANRTVGRPPDELLRARRRQDLVHAAIEIFAQQGYQRTEVQQIADAAGVAKGTVYRYFPSKQALFLAAADYSMQCLTDAVDQAVEGVDDPIARLRTAAHAVADYFQRYPERIELLAQERAEFRGEIPPTHLIYRERRRERFEATIRRAMDQGCLPRVQVRALANALYYLLFGAILCGSVERTPSQLRRLVCDAFDSVLDALCRSKRGEPSAEQGS